MAGRFSTSRISSMPSSALPGLGTDEGDLERENADAEEGDHEFDEEPPEQVDHTDAEIKQNLIDWIDNPNIARDIDQYTLDKLGMLVIEEYQIDETSRAEWKDEAQRALDFALQKSEPKEYPWPGAACIVYPLITSASIEFAARAYPAIVPSRNVVKGVVWGSDKGTPVTEDGRPDGKPKLDAQGQVLWKVKPGEKQRRADNVGEHMSWQLLDSMEYWESQTDTALHQLPIVGGFVRKTYRDFREDENCSELVELTKIVWNMKAKSFAKAPRKSEIQEWYPFQIEEFERDDESFLKIIYGAGDQQPATSDAAAPAPDPNDSEAPHTFIEQQRRYDLDGDGYAEPLIVTVHLGTQKVVRIVANYEEEGIVCKRAGDEIKRIKPLEYLTLYPFLPNMKGGSYPIGFGHLIKPLNEAINTTLNQMFDAGHLQIAGGGFIGSGLSMSAGKTLFSIGEFKPVNNKGGALKDNIFPMPWPGPSPVLFQLLGFLVAAGKEVAAIKDALSGDVSLANTPPTTMVALIDQGMKVYTAIHKRIYRSLKSEFAKLYRLNRIYLDEDEKYQVGDTWREVTKDDYRLGGGVEPVADPTMVTDGQRISRANMVVEVAKTNPLVNPLVATRRLFEAAQIPRIDELLPDKLPPPPQQPPEQALAQQELQIKAQSAQSKMGQERALELMQYTQALLNLQKAKSEASGPQLQWLETQLDLMRMHIEALNTTVKAAAVDASVHAHNLAHHAHMADVAQRGKEIANEQPETGSTNGGGGSADGSGMDEPGGAGANGSGVPGMAPQSGLASLPALSGPPQPGPAGGGGGLLPQ